MAAKDYVFMSEGDKLYLTKKLESGKLAKDKREVTEKEILGQFLFYALSLCQTQQIDEFNIKRFDKDLFTVKLIQEQNNEESDE